MPHKKFISMASAALCVSAVFWGTAINAQAPWEVTNTIPAPNNASQELFDAVSATAPPPPPATDLPTTVEGWIELSEADNAPFVFLTKELAAKWDVTVEKAEIAGVPVYWVTPPVIAPQNENRLFVHIHGGGFSIGYGDAAPYEAISIAFRAQIPVISIDYRTIPLYPFPAALDDVLAVYQELLKDYDPATMAIGGSSAGGNLAMASVHNFNMRGIPTPAAYFGGTPWADIAKEGDSYFINSGIDRILPNYEGVLGDQAVLYAGDNDMTNPLISPVYGDFTNFPHFTNFPPSQLVTGTRDLLLSPTIRVHRNMRAAGVEADLNVYEGISHGEFLVYTDLPENAEVYTELGVFWTDT